MCARALRRSEAVADMRARLLMARGSVRACRSASRQDALGRVACGESSRAGVTCAQSRNETQKCTCSQALTAATRALPLAARANAL